MNNFLKFILFFLFKFQTNYAKYVCIKNQTIEMDTEKIVFFESFNFPVPFDSEAPYCSYNFILNTSSNSNNSRGIFALTNLSFMNFYSYKEFKIFQNKYFFDNRVMFMSLFQGFVLFDDWRTDDCPLESISRINPFHFTDETQIIQIQSTFFKGTKRGHPCLWQFSAPKGFGFKFVFLQLALASDILLTVENSTDVIRTQYKVRTNYAYYNDDKYLKIYLSHSNQSWFNNTDFEFMAQVSIVIKEWKETTADCKIYQDNVRNITVWSLYSGYPNNAKCYFEYLIRSNRQIHINGGVFGESDIDYIKFEDNNETFIFNYKYNDYWFFGNMDGTDRIIKGEFISDGSVQSLGFEIDVFERSCGCVEKKLILNCNNIYLIINTDVADVGESAFQPYCFNLRCNLTLELESNCNKSFIEFNFDNSDNLGQPIPDVYKIFANNTIFAQANPYISFLPSYTYFIPEKKVTFEILSTSEAISQQITKISATASNGPKFVQQIILSAESPFFLMDNSIIYAVSGYYTVEVNDVNFYNTTIEMYSDTGFEGSFYNENITSTLSPENCNYLLTAYHDDLKFSKCEMRYKKFAVVSQRMDFLLFKLSTVPFRGCVFTKRIYQILADRATDSVVVSVANSEEPCTIYVLLGNSETVIKHMWTNAVTENVKLFGGINEKKLILEFKTPGLTIQIPLHSSIFIQFSPDAPHQTSPAFPFQSIISTPNYGVTSGLCFSSYQLYENNNNGMFLKFTVLDYNISSYSEAHFEDGKENFLESITHTGQEFVFKNNQVAVYYGDKGGPVDHGHICVTQYSGLLVFVELINVTHNI